MSKIIELVSFKDTTMTHPVMPANSSFGLVVANTIRTAVEKDLKKIGKMFQAAHIEVSHRHMKDTIIKCGKNNVQGLLIKLDPDNPSEDTWVRVANDPGCSVNFKVHDYTWWQKTVRRLSGQTASMAHEIVCATPWQEMHDSSGNAFDTVALQRYEKDLLGYRPVNGADAFWMKRDDFKILYQPM
jgi:hypothetical protein